MSTTAPTTPYRARLPGNHVRGIERLIDIAARRHGFDRLALRSRNLVRAFPYRNPAGLVYDSGDYVGAQRRVLALADWESFEKRRHDARARGRLRGIGLGHYIELNTGAPRERAEVRVLPEGRVEVLLGTLSAGQGHETSFAQLVAEWLAVDLGRIRLVTGDTDLTPVGGGSHSGRSMRMGAVVMAHACDRIVEQGKQRASERLEVSARDLEFESGRFRVKGTDRSVGLFDLGALVADYDETTPLPSYPFGCAVCEVEVDPETGVVEVVRHTTVDDCGWAVNPLILHGQTHGGIAAGVGQALWEACRYDRERAGSLGELHGLRQPRADQLPMFDTEISEVRLTSHRSECAAAAKAAPRPRSRRWRTPWSTRWPNSASSISTCRSRPSGCGARSTADEGEPRLSAERRARLARRRISLAHAADLAAPAASLAPRRAAPKGIAAPVPWCSPISVPRASCVISR
jgi:carbon-monoxide dehydrogenase large subunit